MNIKAKNLENTAIRLIKDLTIKILCESFEQTNTIDSDNVAVVRGWIMDELYRRDSVKFLEWLETDDVELMDTPSKFFL